MYDYQTCACGDPLSSHPNAGSCLLCACQQFNPVKAKKKRKWTPRFPVDRRQFIRRDSMGRFAGKAIVPSDVGGKT